MHVHVGTCFTLSLDAVSSRMRCCSKNSHFSFLLMNNGGVRSERDEEGETGSGGAALGRGCEVDPFLQK